MSDALRPHGLKHARLPLPSPSPWGCSNSYPLSHWCHPTISSSVAHFSSCPQSLPASGTFPMSRLFASGGQSWIFSFSICPSNEYSGLISFRIDWFDLFSRETVSKGIWLMKLPDSPDFPGGTGSKEPACQCRRRKRCRFNPCVRKNPWRKAWQPTAVFLPENPVEKPGRLQSIGSWRDGHDWSDSGHALQVHEYIALVGSVDFYKDSWFQLIKQLSFSR